MGSIQEIAQLGAPVLRLQAEAVINVHCAEIHQIIEFMQATLAATQGVGIAAPQISISKQIIIIASHPTPRYPSAPLMEPTVMINPACQKLSDTLEKDWEGCLSIPGIRALVPRYKEILVSYTNQQGEFVKTRLEGFVARIFQHEFDHLHGKVYLDRVEDNREIFSECEYFKIGQVTTELFAHHR